MKSHAFRRRLLPVLLTLFGASALFGQSPSPELIETKVRALLAEMTLEEKVGQLVQLSFPQGVPVDAVKRGEIGSILNLTGAAETRTWQGYALESRLKIPLLFGFDVIHGYRTLFPIPLGSTASWDLARIEQAERIAATEAAAAGVHWTFAPMVDIARDPRWGRISEGSGEDPYLGAAIAQARVRGFQGQDLAATDTVLACAKHFAAYGAAQAGRDYFTTDVTERVLREVYLPPFHAAVSAGVGSFMAAFNDLDGTPCSANAFLLDHVLRREWGFTGLVVSDWEGVSQMRAHGNVVDLQDSAAKAIIAGLDMDMQANAFARELPKLVQSGTVPTTRLDEAVARVLRAKFQLGLFDDPYRYCDEARERGAMLRPAAVFAARDLARRSCVLLKNERNVLPLQTESVRIALVGPFADSPADQNGAWYGRGLASDAVTLRRALEDENPGRVRYALGCAAEGGDTAGFAEAVRAAERADVVIFAAGERAEQSGEARSRTSLNLSGHQEALLTALRQAGKPVIMILFTGRPLTIEKIEPLADAILVAWHPGTMGGPALCDVLSGRYNPSGHLPLTWPRSVGQIPIFYNHKNSGRPVGEKADDLMFSRYIDSPNEPQYPFGFGLSYTTFAFDDLRLSRNTLQPNDAVRVTVRVSNTGPRSGETVVQLYVRDRVGSVTRPVRELKGFEKIALAAGESREVSFELSAAHLAFWRADRTFGPEPGDFDVYVGNASTATLSASFRLTQP